MTYTRRPLKDNGIELRDALSKLPRVSVFAEFKPMHDSYLYTVYFMVHGRKFRLDEEFYEEDLDRDIAGCYKYMVSLIENEIIVMERAGPDARDMEMASMGEDVGCIY